MVVHVDELGHEQHVLSHVDTVRWFLEMCRARHISIAPIEYTLEGPSVVHSRLCGWCILSDTVWYCLPDLLFNWESLMHPL